VPNIVGVKGVFALQVSKKELPSALPNYEGSRGALAKDNQNKITGQLYNALKDLSEIEDERAKMY